ncbi:MAG: hypothetical protein U0872_03360 [Planctomycetaceae bacterium]
MKKPQLAILGLLALVGIAVAADDSISLGDRVPAFNVRDITGPSKGKTLCYRCQYGDRPVVTVFTREINDSVVSLVKNVDAQVAANKDKKMASFVVLLTDNADEAEAKLSEIAKKENIKNIPLTIIEGDAGPKGYGIQKDAETTVMMWVDGELKVNETFAKGKLDKKSADALAGQTAKILN